MKNVGLRRVLIVLVVIGVAACGGGSIRKSLEYARAVPVEDVAPVSETPVAAPLAPSVGLSARSFGPGGRVPARQDVAKAGVAPQASYDVIDRANRAAAQGPEEATYVNAIQEYVYTPGTLYQLYTAPMRVTDIALRPGERIIGQPVTGDVVRWVCAAGKSAEKGVEQQHVYLKPTREGLHTNLVINTSERSYFLELHSYKETYMPAVKWRYPHEEMASLVEHMQDTSSAASAYPEFQLPNPQQRDYGYTIEVVDGEPQWTPNEVFDDGRRTYIRFPRALLVGEAPALFLLRAGETQVVNYTPHRQMYVVHRLIEHAELRVGQDPQDIVRIERVHRRGKP